ncbi:MAG: sensor histidine kinase [Chloroflexota bacterium]
MNPRTTFQLLFGASIITLIGTSIQIFSGFPSQGPRLATLGLLIAFGLIVSVTIRFRDQQIVVRGYLFSCTLIVLAIFGLNDRKTGEEAFTLFFILTSCATLLLPIQEAIAWVIGIFTIQFGAVSLAYSLQTSLGWLSAAGGHFMFAGFGYMLRQSNVAREKTEQLYTELQETHAKLQAFTTQSQRLAVAEERNRLAREMHDSLGHRLTVAILQLEGATHLIQTEPARAETMVSNMRDQLKEALAELRRALSSLRQSDEKPKSLHTDSPAIKSLVEDIEQLVSTFQEATGLSIHSKFPNQPVNLEPIQRLAIFRASQELLTNIQRHASATEAWLTLTINQNTITLFVADNGQGMPAQIEDGRFGLRGLKERAEQLHGSLAISKRSTRGTEILFSIPQTLEKGRDLAVEGIRV